MGQMPKRDVFYPVRDTGRQSSGPTSPTPDVHLADIIMRKLHEGMGNPIQIALAVQAAGYTRPVLVPTLHALAGLPPTAILTDRDGSPWAAASVSDADFERYAPWQLVHHPQPPAAAAEPAT